MGSELSIKTFDEFEALAKEEGITNYDALRKLWDGRYLANHPERLNEKRLRDTFRRLKDEINKEMYEL